MTVISEAARGKWRGILIALGIEEKFLTGKNGPCPMCKGKDRWRFTDFERGGGWVCNHCGKGDGFDFLKLFHNWSFAQTAKEIERVIGMVKEQPDRRSNDPQKRIDRIKHGLEKTHREVEAYLASRGLEMRATLRAHPRLEYFEDGKEVARFPAMVAGVISPAGVTVSLHVTWVKDGKKAPVPTPRKMITPAGRLDGAAIRLFRPKPHMGVAEGIETALSAAKLWEIPVWSAVNTTLMEKWVPPKGTERVTIFADHDKNFAGHKAAYALAFRLANEGLEVDVEIPVLNGSDFNDLLIAVQGPKEKKT